MKSSKQEVLFDVGEPRKQPPAPVVPSVRIKPAECRRRVERLKALGFSPIYSPREVEVIVRCYRCLPAFQWTSRLIDAAMVWFEDHAEKHAAAGHTVDKPGVV